MAQRSIQCGSLQELAANDFVVVERCSCGSIHITVGGMTGHVTEEGLAALASALGLAHANLQQIYRSMEQSLGIRFEGSDS